MVRAPADAAVVLPAARAAGRIRVPGDKSISHRYALIAAVADGASRIDGFSPGADCAATLDCLQHLGVPIRRGDRPDVVIVEGLRRFKVPDRPLDARNSGTTVRLLGGLLAAHPFRSVLVGDASLSRRPMRRIIEPLTKMGARIESRDGRLPLTIDGGDLHGITHQPEVPSAQVKSGVLLAGLLASGPTVVIEQAPTRDHTERALAAFGARVDRAGSAVSIDGGQRLRGRNVCVPGDISGAAFWGALAAGLPQSEIEIEKVGLNPSRTGWLRVLERAGASVDWTVESEDAGEPVGRLRVASGSLRSFSIPPDEVPGVIDEIPALAALGALLPAGHRMEVRGAAELRVKESDRISALAAGLRSLGAHIVEFDDGFRIEARPLVGGTVDAADDHRLAMAFAVAAAGAGAPTRITAAGSVDVSYPGFFEALTGLAVPGQASSRSGDHR
jgi:3-phosphoshikimate 1-carboxyvinyltransferase